MSFGKSQGVLEIRGKFVPRKPMSSWRLSETRPQICHGPTQRSLIDQRWFSVSQTRVSR